MSYRSDNALWVSILIALLFTVTYVGCQVFECGEVCAGQDAKRNYKFTQGCYCTDEKGTYNPKDER